ncbi:ATP-binding cassette domain-containing protein [Erysipelothrix amsterdamensis]|uniref:ATP-binding cassette domain-containing protein n=1 Tax=Erysipelothrix amsterdamensis TaxID=2929157 RepID=A0AAU9VLK7_9FIRM|nr:ATP-binding cassette domain-containing protein [Erysipelothrix sp. A18Y020d]CAH2763040.1 ATP-binding cassette domain-containing protein [Erysipelothrix sp. A18Y020d]
MFNISLDVKTKQGRDLIASFSMSVNRGDRIGVVGEEGNGKSVFLKSLVNRPEISNLKVSRDLHPESIVFGYLGQELSVAERSQTILEFVLEDSWERFGDFVPLFLSMVPMLTEHDYDRSMASLSGGECVRIQLLKLQMQAVDCYVLDEPTNNLDMDGLIWFEAWMDVQTAPIIFVSHDLETLRHSANRVLHFEQLHRKSISKLTLFEGSYDEYIQSRNRSLSHHNQQVRFQKRFQAKQEAKWQKQYQKVGHQLQNVNRADPGLQKKMKNLKVQKAQRLKQESLIHRDQEVAIKIEKLPQTNVSSKVVFAFDIDRLFMNGSIIGNNYKYTLTSGEKIAIVGPNGCGKTTLFNEIVQSITGNVGIMHQDYHRNLDVKKNAIENCLDSCDKDAITKVRYALGGLNFTSDEMETPVEFLSGGQKAKISLLKVLRTKPDALLLDEPTRNLSPFSLMAIYEMLEDYKGAVWCITHDRQLIHHVFEDVLEMTPDGFIKP